MTYVNNINKIQNIIITMFGGNHGKKKKSILKKFNWAAFIFCPIWAVAHEVKEGYLGFIPGFWTIIGLYLGCCGNELAYESQSWKYTCEKDFEEREKKWYRAIYIFLKPLLK